MMKFGDAKESPLPIPMPKSKDRTPVPAPKPKSKPKAEDDDIYEEDFEEFVEEPEPPKFIQGSKKRGQSPPDYSLETLKKDLEKENQAALKKEEEEVSNERSEILPPKSVEILDTKLISKQQKRTKDLLEILKLEKESFSIFELLPMTEYDNLANKVKTGDLKNSGTQYNEDRVDREIQLADILKKDAGSQWPSDYGAGDLTAQSTSINKFLNKVSPMIEILLEENLNDKPNKVNLKKSEGTAGEIISQVTLPSINFLAGRFPNSDFELKDLQFFPTKRNFLCGQYCLGAFGTLIVIWDILNPSKPNRFLYSVNDVTAICVSSSKEHILIAGNSIGSLELWDLREPGSSHEVYRIDEKKKISIRAPTYSTDSIEMYTHEGKIQKIIEIPSSKGENFSVFVSDSEGNLVTWSIIELISAEIVEMDFGLRIGGRVKLVKTHRTSARELFPKNKTSACSAMVLDLSDCQRFLFASPNCLNYGNRFGIDTFPSVFDKNSADITSISFANPANFQYFLTGSVCGTVSLYDKSYSSAIASWVDAVGSIVKVAWDSSGRCGFYTVDKNKELAVWDLKKLTNGPVCKIKINTPDWNAIDWVLPESSKHSLILAVSHQTEITVMNLK